MAKFKPVGQAEEAETEKPAVTDAVPQSAATNLESQGTKLVCIGGFNHAAIHSGDTLEIPAAGLPANFTLDGVTEGYFPGQFVKRFNIASHARDEKTLKVKITLQV